MWAHRAHRLASLAHTLRVGRPPRVRPVAARASGGPTDAGRPRAPPDAPPSRSAAAPRQAAPTLPSGAVDGCGYLSTGSSKRRLFYVLQEAALEPHTPPSSAPVAVWLQGGPGASALTGLFHEHGRWTTDEHTGELGRNPAAWADTGIHLFD